MMGEELSTTLLFVSFVGAKPSLIILERKYY